MNAIRSAFSSFASWIRRNTKIFVYLVFLVMFFMVITLGIGKAYQKWDNDADRGAVPIRNGAFGESFETPFYLESQRWSESDSLWFYTTTQGSNLLPYDFFLVLKEPGSGAELLRSNKNIDKFRYLPQKATFFNPDALPLGFAKDEYDGKDYVGYTCAACHTGQVNYKGKAIRIDGGASMSDMNGFLVALETALKETQSDESKRRAFVDDVLELGNNYKSEQAVLDDLKYWTRLREQYNVINQSEVEYGYGRLDAFGRIYNRVLQHLINKGQLKKKMLTIRTSTDDDYLLSADQVDAVLDGVNETIVSRDDLLMIIDRLTAKDDDKKYPGLTIDDVLRIRDVVFNQPNAPVSYPFLWDTTHSDYVQWNGFASNAGAGPLGRNVGEVTGVFATLDWSAHKPWWAALSISARLSGQKNKSKVIKFKSSVDLVNLQRLEGHLKKLRSPKWPNEHIEAIDEDLAAKGKAVYAEYCASCHEVIDPDNWDRVIIAQMSSLDSIKTDPHMAEKSVMSSGSSGNFKHTYQAQRVGPILIPEEAPAAVLLTQATRGMVSTPDADKIWLRRVLDWLYVMAMSFFDNDIKYSVKNGDYEPDTTAAPFQSLLAYKARPLNGIWSTAPYLHNGSVPTMYDLFLPACSDEELELIKLARDKRDVDTVERDQQGMVNEGENKAFKECRPNEFMLGSLEFDPVKMGFKSSGYDGFLFDTRKLANSNRGHEYAAGKTPRADGKILPPLEKPDRMALIEFIKTL